MPFDIEIKNDLVILRAYGDVTNEDHERAFARIVKDSRFKSKSKVLIYDNVGRYAPTITESTELVSLIGKYQEKEFDRLAVVVSGVFHWGVGRMMAAYAAMNDVEFRVFRNDEIAIKWLYDEQDNGGEHG